MAQLHFCAGAAFDELVRLSSRGNRKVGEIAQDIVDEAQRGPHM
jgi:hypothetical protein